VGAYSAGWVYAVGQYNPDKVDGVGLGLVSLAALGVAALTPALAAHWLAYIWRDWRAGADVAGPS
jgi:hypothetical protein